MLALREMITPFARSAAVASGFDQDSVASVAPWVEQPHLIRAVFAPEDVGTEFIRMARERSSVRFRLETEARPGSIVVYRFSLENFGPSVDRLRCSEESGR